MMESDDGIQLPMEEGGDSKESVFNKEVVCEYGGERIEGKEWLNTMSNVDIKVGPVDAANHLESGCKLLSSSLIKNVNALDKLFRDMRRILECKGLDCDDDDEQGEQFETTIFGRLLRVPNSEGEESFFLRQDSRAERTYLLDLRKAPKYSLFPGQFVVVKGSTNNKTILVREIDTPKCLARPFLSETPNPSICLHIATVAGPFNRKGTIDYSSLNGVLEYVSTFQPQVLLIIGPLIEVTEEMFDHDISELFDQVLKKISDKLTQNTHAYVVSSPDEWNHAISFPTPPYEGQSRHPRILFLPSPSLLNISGLILGISSVDIIYHMSKQIVESKGIEGNRIERLCRPIISHGSFYPLYPPNESVSLEIPKYNYCSFKTTPHVMIIPSTFRNFIKNIDGCLFVNPERIRKGTMSRIRVKKSENDNASSVIDSLRVEVFKVNK
ncbi:DNA polymerase alpha subunit B [Brevipalpus obovatus]|uniref:DNA polymerase alpha subunit B n=1 Tax=Brevipalpus obovatus TaxID=246614 RepID=UPI003D9E589E